MKNQGSFSILIDDCPIDHDRKQSIPLHKLPFTANHKQEKTYS